MTVRVLVADDEEMVRYGFRMILEAEEDIRVVGEVEDGQAAVEAAQRLRPDVVLMDIKMPKMDGLEATRIVLSRMNPAPRVVVLTTFDRDEFVYEALKAGASAFLLKASPPEQLATAVRVVAGGDALLHPAITRRLISDFARRPIPRDGIPVELKSLTEREIDVMRLVAKGLPNGEIATRLFLAEATVKSHVVHILAKLGLRDRSQIVVAAYEFGLIEPGVE